MRCAAGLPTTRTTLILAGAVAVLGFLALEHYAPRQGFGWNVMHKDVALMGWVMPYRALLALCVAAVTARLLVGDRRGQ